MSLWHSLRALFARATAADEPAARLWFAGRTQAGVLVDGDSMFRNAVVWACVQYLTRAIGQLPWRVLKELPKGGAERATTHPVDWLLHKRPNPEMGAMTFKQTLLGAALTRGNGEASATRATCRLLCGRSPPIGCSRGGVQTQVRSTTASTTA